jgi:hypothetical protein
MSLEALVGGKTSIFIWLHAQAQIFAFQQLFFSLRCLWQIR